MALQNIIDTAETLSMTKSAVVGITQSRDGTVRAASKGAAPWAFTIQVAPSPWDESRGWVSSLEKSYSQGTSESINLANSGYSWLVGYQGNASTLSGFAATWTQGSYTISVSHPTVPTGYIFKAGDFIQLGSSGKVYTVAADVVTSAGNVTVTLHRPVIETSGSGSLLIGPNVNWTVVCSQLPKYTLSQRNILTWDGAFVFVEKIV